MREVGPMRTLVVSDFSAEMMRNYIWVLPIYVRGSVPDANLVGRKEPGDAGWDGI